MLCWTWRLRGCLVVVGNGQEALIHLLHRVKPMWTWTASQAFYLGRSLGNLCFTILWTQKGCLLCELDCRHVCIRCLLSLLNIKMFIGPVAWPCNAISRHCAYQNNGDQDSLITLEHHDANGKAWAVDSIA